MKLIVNGALGNTGRVLCEYIGNGNAHEAVALVDRAYTTDVNGRCFSLLEEFAGDADCIIDFTHRSQTESLCSYAVRRRLPLVIASTGQTDADLGIIRAASRFIPVMLAANLSGGIALLEKLAVLAAVKLQSSDIEITEIHRRGKADVPSGTAKRLARSIAAVLPESVISVGRQNGDRRGEHEITVHSLRLGDCAGTHSVYFACEGQTVILTHEATGRMPYAEGAVKAALFLLEQSAGLYSEKDLYGE